jgi:hypothetical protein
LFYFTFSTHTFSCRRILLHPHSQPSAYNLAPMTVHARDAATQAATYLALDRRHAGALFFWFQRAKEGIGAHNHKLDVALGDWHAAAGLFSISLFVCGFTHTAAPLQLCRCFPVCPSIAVSTGSGHATPRHHLLFFHHRRRPKGLLLHIRSACTAPIRIARTRDATIYAPHTR